MEKRLGGDGCGRFEDAIKGAAWELLQRKREGHLCKYRTALLSILIEREWYIEGCQTLRTLPCLLHKACADRTEPRSLYSPN